jgi:peptidoglycan/xylan/chitin deacetylase (PgdA/CDA1 family)
MAVTCGGRKAVLAFSSLLLFGSTAALADATRKAKTALTEPGVALTFDDAYIDAWLSAMSIFERHGARATFFISMFDKLSAEQITGLRELREAGHAIGCHGLRHRKAVDYYRKHGIEKYIADEITPALTKMEKAGLEPTCFAYPCSQNDKTTDEALLKVFRHLRSGAYFAGRAKGTRFVHLDDIFTPIDKVAKRGCLYGKGIDTAGDPGREEMITQIHEALDRAKERRELIVLYSHSISTGKPRNHVDPAALEDVIRYAKRIGLRFYTFEDLPRSEAATP